MSRNLSSCRWLLNIEGKSMLKGYGKAKGIQNVVTVELLGIDKTKSIGCN